MDIILCEGGCPNHLAADMHWTTTDKKYHEALRRLAVVLLMLAGVAEGAACRSWPMRSLVLWLLRRAETRVRGFAERAGATSPLAGLSPTGGEAARLVKTFRALAAVFFALSRRGAQQLVMSRQHRKSLQRRPDTPRLGRLLSAGIYTETS
jgi:hypothetical protein